MIDRPRFPLNCKTHYPQSSLRQPLCSEMASPSQSTANLGIVVKVPVKFSGDQHMTFGDAMPSLQLLQERRIAL
jgi:hypothetical protein